MKLSSPTLAIVSAIALTGCMQDPDPNAVRVINDRHTGASITTSPELAVQLPGRMDGLLQAQVAHDAKNGVVVFTKVSRQGWMFPNQAWSNGRKLDYSRLDAQTGYCGSSGCTTIESGAISLSLAQARMAASQGLQFRLMGTRGSIEGNIPAAAFASVLQKAGL